MGDSQRSNGQVLTIDDGARHPSSGFTSSRPAGARSAAGPRGPDEWSADLPAATGPEPAEAARQMPMDESIQSFGDGMTMSLMERVCHFAGTTAQGAIAQGLAGVRRRAISVASSGTAASAGRPSSAADAKASSVRPIAANVSRSSTCSSRTSHRRPLLSISTVRSKHGPYCGESKGGPGQGNNARTLTTCPPSTAWSSSSILTAQVRRRNGPKTFDGTWRRVFQR